MVRMRNSVKEHFFRIGVFIIIILFFLMLFSVLRTSLFGHVEEHQHVYFEIVFLLLMAVLAEVAVLFFKQKSVIMLMVLGILIGPSFINLAWGFLLEAGLNLPHEAPVIIKSEEMVEIFAQLGAIILLFKVGLHSKIDRIFTKENMITAVLGIVTPFFFGYLYAILTGGSFAFAMFVGAALSATSVGITVAILKDMKVLEEKFSEIIIGAAIIDDILALLLLSVVINITSVDGNALTTVGKTFLTAVIFIIGAILTGKYIIKYLDRKDMGPKRFLISLSYMLLFAYIAEFIQLSAIVGAFLAGIILNQSRNYKTIEDNTYGLELVFMPIFFLSLGMLVDVTALVTFFVPILIITVIAMLTKWLACAAAARLARLDFRQSSIVGVGMAPRGEVALIIASIGLTKGILPLQEYTVVSAMALLTSLIAPVILARQIKGYNRNKTN